MRYLLHEYISALELRTIEFDTWYELQDYMVDTANKMAPDDSESYFYNCKIEEINQNDDN
ncbi:MAG: hypothetical protein ACR2FM_05075 [Candidatus Saccharimonadales bacterium]